MSVHNKQELLEHCGHEIEIAYYGTYDDPVSVTIECLTCGTVLVDFEGNEEKDHVDC